MFDTPWGTDPQPLPQSDAFERALHLLGVGTRRLGHDRALMQMRRFPVLGTVGLISRAGPLTGCDLSGIRHPVILNAETPPEKGFQIMTPASVAVLNLGGSDADRRARMHQKWRNRLRRAEDSPLRLRRTAFTCDPAHWLLQAEAAQRRKRRYRALPLGWTLAFAKANPHQAQLFTANLKSDPVAAMLFLRHGSTATYHIGHTSPAGRALGAHTLLLAHAADWLARHGHARLDLGTIDTQNAPGLARFKLGSGAQAVRLGGTWVYWRPWRR